MRLEDIQLEPSPWKHSMLFFELSVAHYWKMDPEVYFAKSQYWKGIMGAFTVANKKMDRIG